MQAAEEVFGRLLVALVVQDKTVPWVVLVAPQAASLLMPSNPSSAMRPCVLWAGLGAAVAQALVPGGRLVAAECYAVPPGTRLLAAAHPLWVGEGAPQVTPVALRRR
jgi:hypothetical protein